MNRISLFILLILLSISSYSQSYMKGKVIDSYTNKTVENVYVENITNITTCETNELGEFSIQASKGDTLVFSSMGYQWKKYVIEDITFQIFFVDQQVYELQKIVMHAPVSYEGLTYKIMTMKPYEDTLHLTMQYDKYVPIRTYQPGQIGYAIDGPITNIYNAYNKHAQNAQKAMELLENKHYIVLANKKLNKEIVLEVTKIPQEYFNEFMAFCSFTDEYLALATEFQIVNMLSFKYEQFLLRYPQIQKL